MRHPTTAATSTTQNTERHPASWMTKLPVSGARMGEILNTSINNDIRRVASMPVCKSRTIARGITIPAHAPNPCTKRKAMSTLMFGARAQPTLPTENNPSPRYSGALRPIMSESGP